MDETGSHIGLKRLIAYRRKTLPAAEREALQEHLSLCRHCTGRLLELRDFEAASAHGEAAGPEDLKKEAWDSLARSLPRKVSTVRPISGAGRREAPRVRRLRDFSYGAAAALLLAVLGVSLFRMESAATLQEQLNRREEALAAAQSALAETERRLAAARGQIQDLEKRPEPPAGRVTELEARVAELTAALEEIRRTTPAPGGDRLAGAAEIEVSVAPRFTLRGQDNPENRFLREGGAVNPVPRTAGRFTAALRLATPPAATEVRLELVDHDGKLLWSARRPGRSLVGDAGASLSVAGLEPGLYRLRIESLRPDGSDLLAEYLLEVSSE